MFQCQRCGRMCDDSEAHTELQNPADSYSPLITVCGNCTTRAALAGCGGAAVLLGLTTLVSVAAVVQAFT